LSAQPDRHPRWEITHAPEWVRLIATPVEQAGLDPSSAEDLATTVVATIEAAVIMSMAARSSVPLQRAGRDLAVLIRAKLAQSG
jgi:hypothetical protein